MNHSLNDEDLVYLLRLWAGFLPKGEHFPARVFLRRQDAERWAAEHPPVRYNPFQGCYSSLVERPDGFLMTGPMNEFVEEEDRSHRVLLADLYALLEQFGWKPPLPDALPTQEEPWQIGRPRNIWAEWWEANAPLMTEAQKVEMWRFLVPQPYRIDAVPLQDSEHDSPHDSAEVA